MRVIATADIHYNHAGSHRLADELIDRINAIEDADVLLVVGDTATADGDALERCLGRFTFPGPKLFVAGNHELWTHGEDSYRLFTQELPRRVRSMGWQWLQTHPYVTGNVAIVGSIGWYDYSFAEDHLNIPRRFYEHKVAPGAAAHFDHLKHLLEPSEDIPEAAHEIFARWNDGKFVKLGRSDEAFCRELLTQLDVQLAAVVNVPHVIAAIHHLPFVELAPAPHAEQWAFAKAFLGSVEIGRVLRRYPNVRHLLSGHSHFPAEVQFGELKAINIGSGYRAKRMTVLEV